VLRREAEKLSAVTLRFGWRVDRFVEEDGGIAVEATQAEDGATRRFTARYLAGCDGARSTIRKQLGFHYRGEAGVARDYMGGRMLSIWFRAPGLYDLIPFPRAWQYWAVNRSQRGLLVAIDGGAEFVFMYQLPAGADEAAITDAGACSALDEALGTHCDLAMIGRLPWTAGLALVAEKFQHGRVFLAGDAVHLFTPTGGLGYNTAIEDAVNLGWKLAATLQGYGGPALLASYQAERRPLALRNTGFAREFADSLGTFQPTAEIEADSTEGAHARQVAGDYFDRHARAEFNIPGITFGGRYDGSPIIAPDGSTPPADAANSYTPTACPGGRPPHAWMSDGKSLFDRFGPGWTLLRLGRNPPRCDALRREAQRIGAELTMVDIADAAVRDVYQADLALIRPDQIVAWRGNIIADAQRLMARVTGR
jgi:2-polyprenyl-6-methoxyphenol hydroxylase-like FAD-dependent oxidoreductase